MAKAKRLHVKSVEVWDIRDRKDATKRVQVNKMVTRVRAGAVGGNRPGTFHAATNFPSKHESPL